MQKQRADIFEDDLDLSKFQPKAADEPARPGPEVLAAAGQGKFVSREPVSSKPDDAAPHQQRRYRTGRTKQFNTRATQETVDGYAAIAEQLNCSVADAVERALHALRRELEQAAH